MATFMQNSQANAYQKVPNIALQPPKLTMPIGQVMNNQSPLLTPPMNLNVPTSSMAVRQKQEIMYGTNLNVGQQRNKNQNIQTYHTKPSNKGSGHSIGAAVTLNNSQIHGRKIDSPKIHVKEVADNRPKTSAQHIRKYTLNESQQLSNLNVSSRISKKQGKNKSGKDNARTVAQKFQQAGITSGSGKTTKSLLMTSMGLGAPLTNKEVKKFDFEATKSTKQAQTPHPSNMSKAQQKQKFAALPPKQNGSRNQVIAKVPAPLKSALKNNTSIQMNKKRHSSQGGVHGAVTSKSSMMPSELFNTPMNQTQRVANKLLSTKATAKATGVSKQSQKSGGGANQNSFGGLPSQSSRTGRQNHYQVPSSAGQVASTIAAAQAKRGRRTKSENRYTKKHAAQRFNKSTSGHHQKHVVHQKLRRSGEIIGSPLSDSLLSNDKTMESKKSHKRTKSPTSGSHPELRQKLAMFNQSSSCGRAPDKKQQHAQDLLSLSSMSSASAGHLQKNVNVQQQKATTPATVGQQQAVGCSFSRLLGKSYFVDGEQFLRHMSPGTPSGEHKSLDADQLVSLTQPQIQQEAKLAQRAISVTHRPNSKTGKAINKKNQQHSSEILGSKAISQSIEVEDHWNRNDINLMSQTSNTQPGLSNQLSQQPQPTYTKSTKHTLNMLSMLSNKASNNSKGSTVNYGCFQTEHARPPKDQGKAQSHSFLNLTQKISTSSHAHQSQKMKEPNSKGFDKMIKQNIKRKNKQEAAETLKKFMQESKKLQRKEELTQRNLEINKLNASRAKAVHQRGETSLRNREDNSNDARRNQDQAFSIVHNNHKSTPSASTNKARSRSCIEKFFSGSSIRHQQQYAPAAPPADSYPENKRDTSIVLEIKQLKREINEEIRKDMHYTRPEVLNKTQINNSSISNRKHGGLVAATAAVVEEKLSRAQIHRKKAANSANELQIDQSRIHKFIMKQKKNRMARQTKEKTIEQEKQLRRKQNLQDLDNFTRGEIRRKPASSHLRQSHQGINIKKGESMLNKTSFSIKKQMELLKGSTQPLRNLRPKTHEREREHPAKDLLRRQDLHELMGPDDMFSQQEQSRHHSLRDRSSGPHEAWDEPHTLLMDDGDQKIVNIYSKKISDDNKRRNSSSKSRRRDLSSSHSRSSPVRFGSSESRRRQQQQWPPSKVLQSRVFPLNAQQTSTDSRKPGRITQASHPLRRRPQLGTSIRNSMDGVELPVPEQKMLSDKGDISSQGPAVYQTLELDSEQKRAAEIRKESTFQFESIEPSDHQHDYRQELREINKFVHTEHSIGEASRKSASAGPAPGPDGRSRPSSSSHYSQQQKRSNMAEKYRSPSKADSIESEAKTLIRIHSAAILIQYSLRKYLTRKGWYDLMRADAYEQPAAPVHEHEQEQEHEDEQEQEEEQELVHELEMEVGEVSEPSPDKSVSVEKVGTKSPTISHMIPSLDLNKIRTNDKKEEEPHHYFNFDKHKTDANKQGLQLGQDSERAVSTARSVFERNTFQEFHQKMIALGLHQDSSNGNGAVSTTNFPQLLAMREEAIQQYESKRGHYIQKKFARKEYSPRTYHHKKREMEVWVEEERKEVKKRKKHYEEKQLALKKMNEAETNQKHIMGILTLNQEMAAVKPNSMAPGYGKLVDDFRLPSSHSYRSNKNGGTASSRLEPSSFRIIDMINESVKEAQESQARPRTSSEEIGHSGSGQNVSQDPGPAQSPAISGLDSSENTSSKNQTGSGNGSEQEDSNADWEKIDVINPPVPQIQTKVDVKEQEVQNPEQEEEQEEDPEEDKEEEEEEESQRESDSKIASDEQGIIINSPSSMSENQLDSNRFARQPPELIPPSRQSKKDVLENLNNLRTPEAEPRNIEDPENSTIAAKAKEKFLDTKDPVTDTQGVQYLGGISGCSEGLKRSANSTDLRIGMNEDKELQSIIVGSPANSVNVNDARTTQEPIDSGASSNAQWLKKVGELGPQTDLQPDVINQTSELSLIDEAKLAALTHGTSLPNQQSFKTGGAPNIRIEIQDEIEGAHGQPREIETGFGNVDKETTLQKPVSPISQESDLEIKCEAHSIESSGSGERDNNAFGTRQIIEPEDPHLQAGKRLATQQAAEQASAELKKSLQTPEGQGQVRVNDQLSQFGEEFTNEIFNMLIAELHIEMDIMINRNAPTKGIFKQNQGIKTDLFAIEKYIDEVQTEMLKPANKQQFIEAISAPLNKNPVAQMEQMQDSKTGSFTHFIDTFPQVLPLDLYLTLEKRRKEAREKQIQEESKGTQEVSSTFIAECEHIHNKVLFDCINDSLLQFKPYSKEGEPMPWSRHTKRLKPADDFTIQETFEIVKHDLFRAAITQAGLLPRREFIIKGVFDEEIFGEFREKKLVSLLAHEMIENENKWLNYEFEEAQVKIDVGDIVLEHLVQEAIMLLGQNQNREFNE